MPLPRRLRRTLQPVGEFLAKHHQPNDPANGAFNIVFKSNADETDQRLFVPATYVPAPLEMCGNKYFVV